MDIGWKYALSCVLGILILLIFFKSNINFFSEFMVIYFSTIKPKILKEKILNYNKLFVEKINIIGRLNLAALYKLKLESQEKHINPNYLDYKIEKYKYIIKK